MTGMRSSNAREKRKRRVRKKVKGTSVCPRLSVFRSTKNIYAQIIDDTGSKTLVDASSLSKGVAEDIKKKGFSDAFVVAFSGDERITVEQARKLLSAQEKNK